MKQRLRRLAETHLGTLVLGVIAVGLIPRLYLALTRAATFDLSNVQRAGAGIGESGFGFYGGIDDPIVWPYPPLYLAWANVATHAGSHFDEVARLLPIAADVALALLVYCYLRRTGASPTRVLASVALIALGPLPIITAGVEGQLDSVAILPAVVAAMVWSDRSQRRAMVCGLLIGVGAAIKTVPMLMLVPLLATVSSRREAAVLCATAAAVPATLFAPFVATDAPEVIRALRYHGYPGGGGLGVLLQPNLVNYSNNPLNGFSELLQDVNVLLVGVWVVGVGVVLRMRRTQPIAGAALMWVGVFAFGINWYQQYLNWGLPFFLMAGWTGWTALLHGVLLPYCVRYVDVDWSGLGRAYLKIQDEAIWVSAALAWLAWASRALVQLRRADVQPRTAIRSPRS